MAAASVDSIVGEIEGWKAVDEKGAIIMVLLRDERILRVILGIVMIGNKMLDISRFVCSSCCSLLLPCNYIDWSSLSMV